MVMFNNVKADAESDEEEASGHQAAMLMATALESQQEKAPNTIGLVGDLNEEERKIARISPTSVRLAIGIEDADDLIEDIDKALSIAYN